MSSSSSAEQHWQAPAPTPLELIVYEGSKIVWQDQIPNRLEIGRQDLGGLHPDPSAYSLIRNSDDIARLVVANNSSRRISRQHVELRSDNGTLEVTNVSRIQPLRCNFQVLDPGAKICFDLTSSVNIELHNRTIVIAAEDGTDRADDSNSLFSFNRRTRTPGSNSMSEVLRSSQMDLANAGAAEFTGWLSEVIQVLQGAVNSPNFLQLACEAVVHIVNLEHAQILLRDEGSWKLRASHIWNPQAELPTPSRQVLSQMLRELKTFWLLPEDKHESLLDVYSVIASPILDSDGAVVGALYADQRSSATRPGISALEAQVVEVLACAVASGLSTRKHQEEATVARITAAQELAKLQQFFSPQLASLLLNNPKLLDAREVEVTVLFCDLRDFSAISDHVYPNVVLQWLNEAQDLLSDCVIQNDGVLVDYVGDATLAMWGAPFEQPNHAERACRAALSMLQQLPSLDERWESTIGRKTEIGIGVSTGVALVGNTGSQRKFKYGPLGRTVNVGSRVQDATRVLQIPALATASTLARLPDEFERRCLGRFHLYNVQSPEQLFELRVDPDDDWRGLRSWYAAALEAFEADDIAAADEALRQLLDKWPDDGPAQHLHHRVERALAGEKVGKIGRLHKHHQRP